MQVDATPADELGPGRASAGPAALAAAGRLRAPGAEGAGAGAGGEAGDAGGRGRSTRSGGRAAAAAAFFAELAAAAENAANADEDMVRGLGPFGVSEHRVHQSSL